jgi:hypothetical protein
MHINTTPLWKAAPRFTVVIDAEVRYDHAAHSRYQSAERFLPGDAALLSLQQQRSDPRVTPRWPCHRIVALSWLVMTQCEDGLRPVRLETRGMPEQDEPAALKALFHDVEQLGDAELVSWGGFNSDLPQILLGAMDAGLRLPRPLVGLLSPWKRGASGHVDLMSEVCGGANPVHLAEVAARLDLPAKLTCRPDLVSRLMDYGKWASVKAVCEGDVLTTAAILMRRNHLAGGSASVLEATQRLANFIAEHCGHRPYAADWIRHGEDALRTAFAVEAAKLDTLAPDACS